MNNTVELPKNTMEYLSEVAKKHNVTPSEVVSGLIIGFGLNGIENVLKVAETPKKRVLIKTNLIYLTEKRFMKRYSNRFDFVSKFGFSNYINEEVD